MSDVASGAAIFARALLARRWAARWAKASLISAESTVDLYISLQYIPVMLTRDLKKGSAEFLVLSLLEERPRHGYEIGKLIEARSRGQIAFRIGSLYPILCRLEDRGFIQGRWVEKEGERRRRFYRLTPEGRKFLAKQRSLWEQFVAAVNQVARPRHA